MSKHITPMDQKVQKEWADVMQQFEVPTSDDTTSITSGDDNGIKPRVKSKVLLVSTTLALAVAIGLSATYYTSKSNPEEADNAISSNTELKPLPLISFVSVKSLLSTDIDSKIEEEKPTYELIEKDFPIASLQTLVADDDNSFNSVSSGNWKTYEVTKTESLAAIISNVGISKTTLKELQKVGSIKSELDKIESGYIVRAETSADSKLTQLITHKLGDKDSYVISYNDKEGAYEGQAKSREIETRQSRKTFFINNSLRFDSNQEGLPREVIEGITKIFDRDVNLTRDLRKGDRVTLVYEEVFHKGNKIADGNILAAELMHNNRIHRAIRFIQDGKIEYFDDKGYDLSNAFKRHPLASYKVSSTFGMRRHPIAKRIRMHTGVDFAAPKGTPVYATGNGVVKHVARKGGYGKTIIIEHSGGYSTLYGHLDGYEASLRPGQKVYLGDKIGYVGSTGQSTGNHLHYEFRINGTPQNPLTIKLPKALSLTNADRKKFKEESHNLIRQLDVLQRFAEEKVDITTGIGG